MNSDKYSLDAAESQMKLPLEVLYEWVEKQGNKEYLRQAIDGKIIAYTWTDTLTHVSKMAAALKEMNLPPKSHIAIASKNCAHWIFADLAIWMSGHVSIPLYPNLNTDTVSKIIDHSDTKLVFVGKLDKKQLYLDAIPEGMPTIAFPYDAPKEMLGWDELILKHDALPKPEPRDFDEVATIIYTSGTTGDPKGVMHTFRAFAHASKVIIKGLEFDNKQGFFSYLPLAHVAERVLTGALSLYSGSTVSFAESLGTFNENLQEAKPTVFLGVPRIWEKFQSGIFQKIPERKLNLLLSIPVVSFLVRKKIRKALGLSSTNLFLTGAAPISKDLLNWYFRLGIEIKEAYGLTENLAFSHFNKEGKKNFGAVGKPWDTVDVQLSDTDEVSTKSPCVMKGYYKNPEKTAEVLKDGRFYTGDQGKIDDQGCLTITGRAKDMFKTSKGKYVVPTPIELSLSVHPLIEQVCVLGSQVPQPVALINLSEHGAAISKSETVKKLAELLKKTNERLSPHERLKRIVVTSDVWSIENEFLTPTMKLKRNKVESHYQSKVVGWCEGKDKVIFT